MLCCVSRAYGFDQEEFESQQRRLPVDIARKTRAIIHCYGCGNASMRGDSS